MVLEKSATYKVFLVPSDVLFSNQLLEDLEIIWELRHIIPNPNVVEVTASE